MNNSTPITDKESPVLAIENLAVAYKVKGGEVEAVRNVSFDILQGRICGIVGESGCGKSTVAWSIVNFLGANGYIKRGSIRFNGRELAGRSAKAMRRIRGNQVSMVFQDPMQALNPSLRIGFQMKEVLTVHTGMRYADAEKQRVGIARALACRPDLVLCDEPVSALDVSVQAAILNLLLDVQYDFGTTLIFISHDLSVVRFISDYVCVMYLGQIVEVGPADAIYRPPYHPYTEALLSAVPIPDSKAIQKRIRLAGDVPSAISPPQAAASIPAAPGAAAWRTRLCVSVNHLGRKIPVDTGSAAIYRLRRSANSSRF